MRLRLAGMVPLVGLVVGSLGGGCSGPTAPPAGHGVATPMGLDAGSVGSAEPPAPAPPRTLELQEFTPLLALPELAAVRAAAEQGKPGEAAKQLEQHLSAKQQELPAEDAPAWWYLLGRLREQAGQGALALAAYRKSAESSWPLQRYARLAAARLSARDGKFDDALSWLQQVERAPPLEEEVDLLTGDVAMGARQLDVAVESFTRHLARERPTERVSAALRLATALLSRAKASGVSPEAAQADTELALSWARRARIENPRGNAQRAQAERLEAEALALLPEAVRRRHDRLGLELELVRIRAMQESGLDSAADEAAEAVLSQLSQAERYSNAGCELVLVRAKALDSKRQRGKATDLLAEPIRRCQGDDDLSARMLYLAGLYAARDGRHTQATQRFADLERRFPKHRLADDARMRAAFSFYELGIEKRFTELLSTMDRDYPDGDMVLDGVFRLAMRRIERGDFSGALVVLSRAAKIAEPREGARGREYAGRERYFLARALMQQGEREQALAEYEGIVRQLPLSYYMLHAYSRLHDLDPRRARRVRDEAMDGSVRQPFSFERRPEFEQPGFVRALELARVGDLSGARREIGALQIAQRGSTPAVLWGVALLYARAGSANLSHGVARGLLTDWPERWPAGDWIQPWEIAFPRPHHALVTQSTRATGVPESLVYAVMREESAFDPDAESPAAAYGLMQVIVPTAKLYAKGLPHTPAALKRPNISITLGSRALADLLKTFPQHPLMAIPGYNAGPGRPRRWLKERPDLDFDLWVEAIPFTETRRYMKRVLASRAAYAMLYEPASAEEAMLLPIRIKSGP